MNFDIGSVVTVANYKQVITKLTEVIYLACDTETTGLHAYLNDELFSIIFYDGSSSYYFNFNKEDARYLSKYCELIPKKTSSGFKKNGKQIHNVLSLPIPKKYILPIEVISELQVIFDNPERTIFFHNAKFDMHMLNQKGIEFKCICFCTENGSRVNLNNLPTYKLSYLSKLVGEFKSDKVDEYIKQHKLYNEDKTEKYYNLVYFPVIAEYGLRDAYVTYKLGMKIINSIKRKDEELGNEKNLTLQNVLDNELKCTYTLFNMERTGILLDRDYTQKALDYSIEQYENAASEFGTMTGIEFSDGELTLKPAFEGLGLAHGYTKGGKASFADSVLEGLNHPLAKMIQTHREWYKKGHTYFESFLNLADQYNSIHCNFRQGGTKHGRLSCSNPNLQNVPKEKKDKEGNYISPFPVRRCFKPREGYFFLMPDFDQMEYRLMLDYAMEKTVIDMVLDGMDIHTATKEQMGVEDKKDMTARDIAKRINFLLLYGGGVAKLAINLFKLTMDEDLLKEIWFLMWKEKIHEGEIASRFNLEFEVAKEAYERLNEANELRQLYFRKLPNVKKFITQVQDAAKSRGFIYNWFGRRCYFNKGTEYTAPNHLISGGCADIVKLAMNKLAEFLRPYKTRMLLQIHDEILFEMKIGEEHLIPEIAHIMQTVYPHELVPLTVGVEYSTESWADKKPYII